MFNIFNKRIKDKQDIGTEIGVDVKHNEKTFELCEPIIKVLYDEGIDFIIFGGFAIFLQMIKFNNEQEAIFNFEKRTRVTDDMDILSKSIRDVMILLESKLETRLLLEERNLTEVKNSPYLVNEAGTEIALEDKRGIDILSCIQGYRIEDMEYDIVEYRGYSLKIATVETLMDMKTKLIETYGDGARDKDKSDLGLLSLMIEKKNEGGLKW